MKMSSLYGMLKMKLSHKEIAKVSEKWGEPPDDAIKWATVPLVDDRITGFLFGDKQTYTRCPWTYFIDLYYDRQEPLDRVLSLCCGHGHLERLIKQICNIGRLDALDISNQALKNARRLAREAGFSNINYKQQDVNQLKLSESYDLVVASGVHHLWNLEHVFAEVARMLQPEGAFLMYEYIGPSKTQPTPRQLEAINACIKLLPEKYRIRVTAQRELEVATPEEALKILERRRATSPRSFLRNSGGWKEKQAVEVEGIFSLDRTQVHNDSIVQNVEGLRIRIPSEKWCYAVEFRIDEKRIAFNDFASGPVKVVVDLTLEEGAISLGVLEHDGITIPLNKVVMTPGRQNVELLVEPLHHCRSIIIRNGEQEGYHWVKVHGIKVFCPQVQDSEIAKPPIESDAKQNELLVQSLISSDPDFSRYFWNEYIPMSREQWNAQDPTEAIRSYEIIPLLKDYFSEIDVRYFKGSLLQFTLYDLAANFYKESEEVKDLMEMLFKIEDVLMKYDDIPETYAFISVRNVS